MGRSSATSSSSSSSNIAETTNYQPPFFSYDYQYQYQYHQPQFIHTRDLSTDLKLGLSLSPSQTPRGEQSSEWPSTSINGHQQPAPEAHPVMEEEEEEESDEYCVNGNNNGNGSLYVKVYMEGHPIGRKLNVLAHHDYHDLITTLDHMFNTNILWGADVDHGENNYEDFHVLTYEDEEGDWLMVGDVPWEMFLTAVKRLKITRACPC
ncbi:auxin-responsive protein IAA30-like [Humulus lupulus]|uniref:auxin-responsive protein IAA30-like n=1 Tax=Humulus lupulus TaxID=3486 RepID=UPI002B4077A3|nr:auxin-responsive protein IAA30-like [Humulus lupulus]